MWYRVLLDRFENGNPANDPEAADLFPEHRRNWELSKWTENWYALSPTEQRNSEHFYDNAFLRQYGGDLEGVRNRLGYLKGLGVTGLMLSPVFESASSHKYDVHSYHHIDPRLAPHNAADTAYLNREQPDNPKSWYLTSTDRGFVELLQAAHDSDMKVIVDVQVAHVSVNFWAFKDLLHKQEKSAYGPWFVVTDWDRPETPFSSEFEYKAMFGVEAFPELRKDSLGLVQGPREYVFASIRRWMDPNGDGDPSDGVDGWRVELSSQLSRVFWEQFIGFVHGINPSAIVIGEPHPEMPKGKRLFDIEVTDTFARLAHRLFLSSRCTPTGFESGMADLRGALEPTAMDAQVNWIDNYETDRAASMCVNPALEYESMNSLVVNPGYDVRPPTREERVLQRMLILLQFAYPGSPEIYYGDEAGMWGGDDPDCRKPMLWPDREYDDESAVLVNGRTERYPVRFDSTMFAYYNTLITLRRENIALRSGSISTIVLDDERFLYGFVRQAGANRVYVLFNAGMKKQECIIRLTDVPEGVRVDAPLQRLSYFTDREGLQLVLPPRTGMLLIPAM